MSNRPLNKSDTNYENNIYKNNYELVLGTDLDETDPHYCAYLDELYFEIGSQTYVYRKNQEGYTKLGEPINLGSQDYQPFLTEDCQTMYFSSDRERGKLAIYSSERIEGDKWSEPKKIIWNVEGVGEPTLTADRKQLFFVAVNKYDDGSYNSDIFYIKRK